MVSADPVPLSPASERRRPESPQPAALPPVPPDFIRRGRLHDRLDAASSFPVVVVTGPAGSGKSTLLAGWGAERTPGRTAWLSAAAAGPAMEDLAQWLAASGPDRPGPAAHPVLVIDDVHVLDELTAARLHRVIRTVPPGRSIVLAGRDLGRLSLVDLGLARRVVQIPAHELAFLPGEAAELLGMAALGRLDDVEVERLLARAEGWAVALRLASIGLEDRRPDDHSLDRRRPDRRRPDRRRPEYPPQAASAGGASAAAWGENSLETLVGSYLDREVLSGLSSGDLDALLLAAVTPSVTVEMAEALTGRVDVSLLLESMARRNRFLERCADGSYRFHPLMAAHLRRLLAARGRAGVAAAHSSAAKWLAANGDEPGAIDHLLRADEQDQALAMAVASVTAGLTSGLASGPGRALPGAFPLPFLTARRVRMYPVVVSLLARSRLSEASEWLRRFEAGLAESQTEGLGPVRADRVRAEWLWALHDSVALYPEGASAHWERAQALISPGWDCCPGEAWLPALDEVVEAMARWAAARSRVEAGRTDEARALLERSLHLEHEPHGPLAVGALASVALAGGRLREAAELAGRALTAIGPSPVRAIDAHLTLAETHYERDDLVEARRLVTAARRLAEEAGLAPWAAAATVAEARLELSDSAPRRALGLLDTVLVADTPRLPPSLIGRIAWVRFRCRLALGDVEGARDVLDVQEAVRRHPEARARLHLSAGRPDRAAAELGRSAGRAAGPREEIEWLLLHARAHLQLGAVRAAEHSLQRALELGRSERYVRVFVEEPPQVAEALRHLASHRPDGYLQEILDRSRPGCEFQGAPAGLPAAAILEPLTDRERELVAFLPSHLTQHEIARQMYISANTVKTHMKGLYRKLGANSRSEAVELARGCGLL